MLLDYYLRSYDSYVIIGDMNLEPNKNPMKRFICDNNLYNLIKKPTCFKSIKGTCIDLILTNKKFDFKFSDTYETGLSDCHTLIHTMFKSSYYKLKPKRIVYRNYKNFNNELFVTEVTNILSQPKNTNTYENLELCLLSTLNRYAPVKQKIIRGNNKPFISKDIRKEIFKRSKLKNKFNKTGAISDWTSYKKQRNYVCALVKNKKNLFFSTIDIKPGLKSFWKACKPYLVSKSIYPNEKITLCDNGKLVSDETEIAQIFNSYFANILNTLDIHHWEQPVPGTNKYFKIYPEYNNHPSILKIEQNIAKSGEIFNFQHVEPIEIIDIITKLKKGSGEMPIHILKLLKTSCSGYLAKCINTAIDTCTFPESLKWAEVLPIFKNKGEADNKENYRHISILPTISKVFERIIFDQINSFMQNKFSKFLCGF